MVKKVKYILVELEKVISAGRLDFEFYNPSEEKEINLVKGYTQERLGDLCTRVGAGKTAPRGGYTEYGIRIVKVKNIRGNGINWETKFFVPDAFWESAKKARVQEGDILMLCTAHNKNYIGRTDIITKFPKDVKDDDERCMCVGELIVIRADSARVQPEYLITYLRLPVVQEKIRKMIKGQSAHLYPRDLVDLMVVLPPKDIQQEIAEMNLSAEQQYIARIRRAEDDLIGTRRMISNIILTGGGEAVDGQAALLDASAGDEEVE